jgi:hypothetical protein
MFAVFCAACSRRQLIFPGQVLGIVNDGSGIHVVFRCGCRETSVWHTGRRAEPEAAAA